MSFLRSRSNVSDNYLPVTVLYLPVIIYSGLFLTGNGQELHNRRVVVGTTLAIVYPGPEILGGQ